MGVKHLWSIVQPVATKEPLESLHGKTLCVDLSTWICQAEETLPLKNAVEKPYLRNTIFRVLCLKRLGTRLIFLTEGKPPQLKWNAILARTSARKECENEGRNYSGGGKGQGRYRQRKKNGETAGCIDAKPKKIGRTIFQRKINECSQLLRYLGIPVIKSEGEAEACCAVLDKNKLADGCITQDGDTFLYGATVVYRNLTISNKDPHVYRYSMDEIKSFIGIDRKQLVALSLLFGCDYCDGVHGIGVKTAMKLLKETEGSDILQRFRDWGKERKLHDSASPVEKQVFRKLMQIDGFPNEEVIKEFLQPRDDFEKIKEQISWDYPDLVNIQRFCFQNMNWPEEYTLSKVLGVATNEHLNRISRGIPVQCPFIPSRLVKTRTLHRVPLCEMEWTMNLESEIPGLWTGYPDVFITLESQQEILHCLPDLVKEFEKWKLEKKTKSKKSKREEKKKLVNVELNESVISSQRECDGLDYNEKHFDKVKEYRLRDGDKDEEDSISVGRVVARPWSCVMQNDVALACDTHLDSRKIDGDDIKDLVDSFVQIDLTSIGNDSPAVSKNVETSTEANGFCPDDITTSTPDCEPCLVLPLRERLRKKAMAKRRGAEVKRADESMKPPSGASTLAKLKQATQYEAWKKLVSAPTEVTSSRKENIPELTSLHENGGEVKTRDKDLMNYVVDENDVMTLRSKDIMGFDFAQVGEIGCISDDSDESVISEPFNLKTINVRGNICMDTADEKVARQQDHEKTLHGVKEATIDFHQLLEHGIESRDLDAKQGFLAKERRNENIEVISMSNDSLGCILSENANCFDSPQLNEDRWKVRFRPDQTPDPNEYVVHLRNRLGIVKQLTPVTWKSIHEDSQTEESETQAEEFPLSLMERLKRRQPKT